jgi:hypothetical protein
MLQLNPGRAAGLRYTLNNFEVLSPGDHVICAVTGKRIPLDMLRYWSPERQEPYADAVAASQALRRTRS